MDMQFEKIYEQFFKDVYLYIFALSRDPHLAEDITQETFFKAMKGLKHFRGDCSVKSWLCQIAKNLYLSHLRKNKNGTLEVPETLPSDIDLENSFANRETAISIYRILHVLEEPYKEVFTLRTLGDLSYREIADIFGKQENWARVTYHRAKLKIRETLVASDPTHIYPKGGTTHDQHK